MARPHSSHRQGYEGVAVAVPVTIPYERYSIETAHWWIGRALAALAKAAHLSPRDFDGLSVSSFTLSPDTAIGLTQHFDLSPRWLDYVPMGGASGLVALRKAARAVQAGDADIIACVAGDTNHVDSFRRMLSSFSRFAQDAVYPYGSGGPNASFALIMQAYMQKTGLTRADMGRIAVSQRINAQSNPHALLRGPLTLDDYLAARPIADPIHIFDCVMPCAGAEAFLVLREDIARSKGLKSVRIKGTIERHNAFAIDPIQVRGGWRVDIEELYTMGDVAPGKVDFVQTYDDYPVISAMQMTDLGLCAEGDIAAFVRSHTFTVDGTCPHNTSGGQLSVGQAGCGGGYLGLVESIRQLTDAALGKQVANAQTGLVSGFGMITYDRGLASAAALLGRL
jgi:acetyl-CoA acetyltransferase